MARVSFLPEELGRAQEEARPQFPAHDVGPLVQQHRQVAVALQPLREVGVDDGLARGPDDEGLLELVAAAVGDHRQLGAEALDVLGFLGDERHRDEEREVGVLGARLLDATVDLGLHALPDRPAVRSDDHRSPGRAVLGQLGLGDHVLVPPGKVLALRREHARLRHREPRYWWSVA